MSLSSVTMPDAANDVNYLLADILGVNRGTISEWENAHSMLPADKLLAWADACNAWWMVRSPAQCV